MKLNFTIKPDSVETYYCTIKAAKNAGYITSANVFGYYGEYSVDYRSHMDYAIVQTYEVFKRHRPVKDRHVVIRTYRIPLVVLDALKIAVHQKNGYVRFSHR